MAAITNTTDFIGEVNIAQNQYSSEDLASIIDTIEETELKKLLGVDLYIKFKADNFGQDAGSRDKYKELLSGLQYTDPYDTDLTKDYTGIKRMLRLFIYNEYLYIQADQNTIIGMVKGSSRNAENLSQGVVNEIGEAKQRIGVDLYDDSQTFITNNNDKEYSPTSIVDQTGNVYLVSLASTKYILDGDSVEINGKDYTVSNLITDTSFEISETSGTVFPSTSTVKFELFPTYKGTKKKKVFFGGMI